MRQIIGQTGGVVVARVPRPVVEAGKILVRVQYSFVSVGTELAAIAPLVDAEASVAERGKAYGTLAWTYLGKAIRDPRKAASRLSAIAQRHLDKLQAASKPAQPVVSAKPALLGLTWEKQAATAFKSEASTLAFLSDDSPGLYQVASQGVPIPAKHSIVIRLQGEIDGGAINLGVLNATRDRWIGTVTLAPGSIDDSITFDVGGSEQVFLIFSNANIGKPVRVTLRQIEAEAAPPADDGLPATELSQQGWGLGYSVAGTVVAVGEGVAEYKPGDKVACGGAGKANHADFVVVPKNLACRVPDGCSLQAASSISVGSIALQGVRRADPRLGELVCVVGLGLIGLITVQMLRASGCRVVGYDPDQERVDRAKGFGLEAGVVSTDALKLALRDLSYGHGADITIITAATKSDAPINLAMQATRPKGRVVIVGDIGMKVERADFYRKEIDLLMSTSYGPGRYDRGYEEEGRDYPFGYVRWTENRNMACFLDLVARGQVDIESLIDLVVPVNDAPAAYRALGTPGEERPLGVLLHYPDDQANPQFQFDNARIAVRGHGRRVDGPAGYVLVGAGGFGVSTLAPIMASQKGLYHLRGAVSRDAVRGGNFVRANRAEILASDMSTVLTDTSVDLLVIATRHDEHAEQVMAGLRAGKHVFVEKPLAITWEQLDAVARCYNELEHQPLLMVGFNRRFSPALQALRGLIAERRGPLVINYRLNAGYIPLDHWVQGPAGGGRNIGEACHMYDVFRSLAGKPVAHVHAQAIDPYDRPLRRNDNFVASLGYADGSLATLTYTALGPKQGMPKERIEIFCDGEAYIVDDFKRLIRCSDDKLLWESAEANKGHAEELRLFGEALRSGSPAPISFDELVETTAVSLAIEDQLNGIAA